MTPAHPYPAACAEVLPECARRFGAIETKITAIEDRQRTHGESIATIRAQITIYAALGGGIGAGAVVLLSRLLKV